jgi:uncharacterized membrane protein (DUF485 family)
MFATTPCRGLSLSRYMMSDVVERFRYRFQLWRREQREGSFWRPSTSAEASSRFDDPKYRAMVTESGVRSVGRSITVYFGIIIIAAQLCRMLGAFIPSARSSVTIGLLVFVVLWTLMSFFLHIDLYKARRAYRQEQASKSSNQSLQPTADRPDDLPSIHETAFTPKMPRFRQR